MQPDYVLCTRSATNVGGIELELSSLCHAVFVTLLDSPFHFHGSQVELAAQKFSCNL